MGISAWTPQWIIDITTTGQEVNDALDTAFTNIDAELLALDGVVDDVTANTTAVANFTALREVLGEPTGYDLRTTHKEEKGIMEFCVDATSGTYWSINELDKVTKHT